MPCSDDREAIDLLATCARSEGRDVVDRSVNGGADTTEVAWAAGVASAMAKGRIFGK